jgi:hypothetical protein
MSHEFFKAHQTAAIYVAEGLGEVALEEFELHMMSCRNCVDDVESWRAIKQNMPGARAAGPARRGHVAPFMDWRMAASLLGVGVLGAAGGWVGRDATHGPDVDSAQTVVFNLPAATRSGDECTVLRMGADTRVAVLRVPGVPSGLVIAALDAERHPLPAGHYATRAQSDGSHLVRMDSQVLMGRAVYLQTHRGDGAGGEPLGCVTGELASQEAAK